MISEQRVCVLYIAGYRSSGSTILHNVLGQVGGLFAVGETRNIWSHGFVRNVDCGCGKRFKKCPFWQDVAREAFGGLQHADAQAMIRETSRAGYRPLPLLLHRAGRDWLRSQFRDYIQHLAALYRAVQSVSGCRGVVDSSKVPLYAYLLSQAPDIDLRVLHLTRDVHGAVFSRGKSRQPGRPLVWNAANVGAEMLPRYASAPYLHVRYEDFARRPRLATKRILTWLGEGTATTPFSDASTFHKHPTHSVAGNPSRHKTGRTEIRISESWKTDMPLPAKLKITLLTWPLLLRYGYPLWAGENATATTRARAPQADTSTSDREHPGDFFTGREEGPRMPS